MKYAIVNDLKTEASKGVKGICPNCSSEVIAKCGERKVNHWAHKNTRICDSWWESETEWHRSWKNRFPDSWQERSFRDEVSGEKHIADILTNQGLVIEFQHSHIKTEERLSREKFYKNLIWVIDGTRLKRDYPRFTKGKEYFRVIKKGIYRVDFPEECFPVAWLDSSVPVIFDFLGNEPKTEINNNMRKPLYCIFPVKIGGNVIIAEISRITFVNAIIGGQWLDRTNRFMEELTQVKKERQNQVERIERKRANLNFQNIIGHRKYRKSRRF